MRVYVLPALLALFLAIAPAAGAAPFRFTRDYTYDNGYYLGDGTSRIFEIWEIGARIEADRLEFSILMDLPEGGTHAADSYAPAPLLSPGDLWITVGTNNPFDPAATRHAIALTTRSENADYDPAFGGNIVRQKYPGEVWPEVTKGRLYKNADWSTGTYETYQKLYKDNGWWYTPDDTDGDDTRNSYLALIRDFDPADEIEGHSDVTWTLEPYWDWDENLGDWVLVDSWRITGWVELDQIGLTPGTPYSLFISSECGNDGAEFPPVPEPFGAALFVMGLIGAASRRK